MSKEMLIIVLGVWTLVLTQLGIPYHPWGVFLYVCTGVAVAITGFLLRGETLGRSAMDEALGRNAGAEMNTLKKDEHNEGIGSLT